MCTITRSIFSQNDPSSNIRTSSYEWNIFEWDIGKRNKGSTGLNGHLSIRDSTLTSCLKGAYSLVIIITLWVLQYTQLVWSMPRSQEENFKGNNAFSLYEYGLYGHTYHRKPWPGGHEILNFGKPFLGHNYFTFSISDLWPGVHQFYTSRNLQFLV